MKKARIIFLLLLFVPLRPLPASAASDLIDWLGAFSGPGPFFTHKPLIQSVSVRVACIKEDPSGGHHLDTCFLDDMDDSIKVVIGATYSWTASNDPRFKDAPANDPFNTASINLSRIEGSYSYRVSPMLDVGVGGGVLVFTGEGFSNQTHPFLTAVQFTFVPFGFLRKGAGLKWGRVLQFSFADRYVLGDINARADFGSASNYLTHGEFNPSFRVGFDFLPLFARGRK